MAKVQKITEEELNGIVAEQKEVNTILNQLGLLESNKHVLLHKLDEVNRRVEKTKSILEDKYGAVNINLEDGVYTKIEDKE